jgi:D-threo-aldose 1-dehydrogenase
MGRADLLARLGGATGLGFGGAPLGNLYEPVAEDAARAAVQAAWDAGIRYFDTAPLYGHGLSESRIGSVLGELPRDAYCLSTKVGRVLEPVEAPPREQSGYVAGLPFRARFDYGAAGVQRSLEDSLRRLRTDRIDVVYIHDVDRLTHGAAQPARFAQAMDGAYPALARLREQGVVGAIGLGVNEWEVCAAALAHGDFDCFMLAGRYTLLDQSARETLLPLCAQRGVRLVLGGVYNSGILATGAVPGARYDYQPAGDGVLARTRALQARCDAAGVPLRAAALQFALRCPQACAVVVGARSAAEVRDNLAMARWPIVEGFWDAIAADAAAATATGS